jgi:ketopantoate reductase
MQVVVVGPGAVGCLLGGLARLAGHEVTLVGRRGAIVAPAEGIRITQPGGWSVARGFLPAVPAEPDRVMVALGRHHLAELKRGGLPLPETKAPALFWNCDPGVPSRLGLRGAWSVGLTLLCAVQMQAADVELAPGGATLVVERGSGCAALLRTLAGLRTVEVEDIAPLHDSFLVSRLLELPAAMCGTTVAHLLAHPAGRELASSVLAEGIQAMERSGRPLARLPHGDPRELLAALARRPRDFDRQRDLPGRAYPTVLQAFLRGRPSEARELNRRIVEIASEAGLSLSWNWRLFQKSGRVATVGFFRDPAELVKSI